MRAPDLIGDAIACAAIAALFFLAWLAIPA